MSYILVGLPNIYLSRHILGHEGKARIFSEKGTTRQKKGKIRKNRENTRRFGDQSLLLDAQKWLPKHGFISNNENLKIN